LFPPPSGYISRLFTSLPEQVGDALLATLSGVHQISIKTSTPVVLSTFAEVQYEEKEEKKPQWQEGSCPSSKAKVRPASSPHSSRSLISRVRGPQWEQSVTTDWQSETDRS
jgi:hypothetical protein